MSICWRREGPTRRCRLEAQPWPRHTPGSGTGKLTFVRLIPGSPGKTYFMLTLLLLVLLVVVLLGAMGPRYYRGRGRRTVVREYETDY